MRDSTSRRPVCKGNNTAPGCPRYSFSRGFASLVPRYPVVTPTGVRISTCLQSSAYAGVDNMPTRQTLLVAMTCLLVVRPALAKDTQRDALWAAARNGDPKAVRAALDSGADVNAKSEIGITALWIAASKGKMEVIDLLLERGADVNARDGIWYQTPLSMSVGGFGGVGNVEAVKRFLKAGAKDIDAAAMTTAARGNVTLLQLVLDTGKVSPDARDAALHAAPESSKQVREALTKAGAKPLAHADPKEREAWAALAGTYENDNAASMTVKVVDVGLVIGTTVYRPAGSDRFTALGNPDAGLAFERTDGKV